MLLPCFVLPSRRTACCQLQEISAVEKAKLMESLSKVNWVSTTADMEASQCRLMTDSVADGRQDNAFIHSGFSDWMHAIAKFDKHERSISHKFACSQLTQSLGGVQIAAKLNDQQATD